MKRLYEVFRVAAFVMIVSPSLMADPQSASTNPSKDALQREEDIARIVGYCMTRGGASAFLETLTDSIGGRITGSPQSVATADLILKTLKDAGFDNAHFEEYELKTTWQRESATGEVVSPIRRALMIGSYGWVPGTPGAIEVPAVNFAPSDADRVLQADALKGAAVLVDLRSNASSSTYVGTRFEIAKRLAEAGAAAMFIVSDKPHRMLYMSAYGNYPRAPLPILSIASDDAAFLRRLMARGPVRLRLDVRNSFGGPVRERNVVADIEGTEPSGIVLFGAHFDSWDPAQGAFDNGMGVAVGLEAARVLRALKIRPKQTVRFAFFSGEEQYLNGSGAYVEQHKPELDKTWAMFNTHGGAAFVEGLLLNGRKDLEAETRKRLEPLAALAANGISLDANFDGDNESFMVVGVPTYSMLRGPEESHDRHHTIVDTFERIDPRMLSHQTAVTAVAAYSFANADRAPGRRLSPAEVLELMKRTGLEHLYEMEHGPFIVKSTW